MEQQTARVGCVVMAAGNAKRFGENKLAAVFDGKTLIEHALDAAAAGRFDRVVVVTQYPEIEDLAKERCFDTLRNEHPDWGISHTISLGTDHLRDCEAILYLVSDQPLLGAGSVERVVEAWRENPGCIVGAAHNGRRGSPCIFPRAFYDELLALRGDNGGNLVIRDHPDRLLLVEVAEKELTDVDTPEALAQLKEQVR